MKPRMNFYQAAPDTIKALTALEAQVQGSGLEQSLIELVKTRASQINGCAFCINMHTQDARKHGETEQRLYLLNAWRESPVYTDRERAALAWTEAVTLISETHQSDHADCHHQCVEPACNQLPRRSPREGQGRGGLNVRTFRAVMPRFMRGIQ